MPWQHRADHTLHGHPSTIPPRADTQEEVTLASPSPKSHLHNSIPVAKGHSSKGCRSPNFTPLTRFPLFGSLTGASSISVPISNPCCPSSLSHECSSLLSCLSPLHAVILSHCSNAGPCFLWFTFVVLFILNSPHLGSTLSARGS